MFRSACSIAMAALFALSLGAQAQARKDTAVLGMILEPTSLDEG